jgi:hypothetical protein
VVAGGALETGQVGGHCQPQPISERDQVSDRADGTFLAEAYRGDTPVPDLLALAMRLAATPCGPLYSKHVSPDRELAALWRSCAPPAN